jgi:serine/threonine-protein kinase
LGAGGMSEIYEVGNVISDRVEAMKVLLSDLRSEAELAERFMREIKLQARLRHQNIAGLHTAFEADGQLIMIMELVDGETLSELLGRNGLDVAAAVDAALQSLSALDYAHSEGVVHRDIKPSNIMVTGDGVVKIMDFGIAKAAKDESLTRTGNLIGSLHYMSPEQVRGDADVDGRTDIYSLGVVLYEMVTGRKPFDGNSEFSIMKAHLEEAPVPPDEIDSSVDPDLSDVILTAMAKDRGERYQRAGAFLADLKEVTSGLSVGGRVEPLISRPDSKPAIDPEITGYQRVSTGSRDIPSDEPIAPGPPPVTPESKPVSPSRSRLKTISGERPAPPPILRDEPVAPPEPAIRNVFPKVAIGVGIAAAIALGFLIPSWFSSDSSTPPETVAVAKGSLEVGGADPIPPAEPGVGGVDARPTDAAPVGQPVPSRPVPVSRPVSPPPVTGRPPGESKSAPGRTPPPVSTDAPSKPPGKPDPDAAKTDPPPAKTTPAPAPTNPTPVPPVVASNPASSPARTPPQPAAPKPAVPAKPVPDPDRVYTIKEPGVSPPQMVHQVQPQYTAQARTNRTQGRVILQAEVWPDGLPHNIEILKSIGDAGLDQNAIAALRQWRFAAGAKDGQPVKVRIAVALSFRLM